MQINEHQKRSRYPNFQIPPCAPAVAYTPAIANEALMATKDLFYILMRDEKIAPLLKGIEELPIPQFTSMLLSLGGSDGKQLMWLAVGREPIFMLNVWEEEERNTSGVMPIVM